MIVGERESSEGDLMRRRFLARYITVGRRIIHRRGFKAILKPSEAYHDIVDLNAHRRIVSLLDRLDYSHSDLDKNRDLMNRFNHMKKVQVETVNWFIPNFRHMFGGVYTILRFADYFRSKKGIRNRFIICGDLQGSESNIVKRIAKSFPGLSSERTIVLGKRDVGVIPNSDISIATSWDSAHVLLKFNRTKGKFYFIQDYEPLFYPAGTAYALAETTYRFGFHGIINSPGVLDVVKQEHGSIAEYFTPSVDRRIFYPSVRRITESSENNPFAIFFYARPEIARNAFDLGISALQRIEKKHGKKVRVFAAGSNWYPEDYGMEGRITQLGTMSYEKTAEIYRKCDLGVVFMFTKHPSYLPFELMACGCPVLTNYNPSTTWFLKDGKNCALTQPSVSSVCEKIEELIEDPEYRSRLVQGGLDSISKTSWDEEIEKIYRFICRD